MSALLKGLEASINTYKEVLANKDRRVDSDFWTKEPYRNPDLSYVRIGDHLTKSQYGISIAMNEDGEGVPIYRMNEMHDMLCDYSIMKAAEVTDKEKRLFGLNDRDVIFNRTNSYQWVGRTGLYKGNEGERAIFASYLVRFRTDEAVILPEFLTAFLSCRYGQQEVKRRSRQSINQTNVNPEEVKEILIPALDIALQRRLKSAFDLAHKARLAASEKVKEAEEKLLLALGLADWTPPEPLSYTARASEAFAGGRLDARFFAPRIQALLDILGRDGRSLRDFAAARRQKFRSQDCESFNYIEIGDIDGSGAATSTPLACADAPSRATWHVRPNDIVTSTVRPIRRLSAQIAPEQDGYVASSCFVVIDPQQIAPELLLTFLRLPVICELLDIYASASMYPAVTEAHILGLPFPMIGAAVETQVVANIQEACAAKDQAAQLLQAAKRAVEIAIEDGEPAALAFLNAAQGAN